jgi:hypothetical protein
LSLSSILVPSFIYFDDANRAIRGCPPLINASRTPFSNLKVTVFGSSLSAREDMNKATLSRQLMMSWFPDLYCKEFGVRNLGESVITTLPV